MKYPSNVMEMGGMREEGSVLDTGWGVWGVVKLEFKLTSKRDTNFL